MLGPVSGGPSSGAITAGNASQMSDGAAALLVVNDAGLAKLGSSVTPLARVHTLALAANDPVIMLDAPVPATQNALKRSGLSIDDIGLYEVNEAFAVVPMAWSQTVGADEEVSACVGGGEERSDDRRVPPGLLDLPCIFVHPSILTVISPAQ